MVVQTEHVTTQTISVLSSEEEQRYLAISTISRWHPRYESRFEIRLAKQHVYWSP